MSKVCLVTAKPMITAPHDASCFNSNQMISGPGCHPPHPRYQAHTFKNKRIRSKREAQKEIEADVKNGVKLDLKLCKHTPQKGSAHGNRNKSGA